MKATAVASLALTLAGSPLSGQRLDLKAERDHAALGDLVRYAVTVRLQPEQRLLDLAVRTLAPLPDGVRVVALDTLVMDRDGSYRGGITFAFYRLGLQPVPTIGLLYQSARDSRPDTLLHSPLAIQITGLAPGGTPTLKDIRPLESVGSPRLSALLILGGILVLGLLWLGRVARLRQRESPLSAPIRLAPGPFAAALARLDALEQAHAQSGNGAAPLYAEVSEVIRGALLDAGAILLPGLTTPEIGAALPAALAARGQRARCDTILADADLVKFARLTPDHHAAQQHLQSARILLRAWVDGAPTALPHALR
jgi:hypothetical protein